MTAKTVTSLRSFYRYPTKKLRRLLRTVMIVIIMIMMMMIMIMIMIIMIIIFKVEN